MRNVICQPLGFKKSICLFSLLVCFLAWTEHKKLWVSQPYETNNFGPKCRQATYDLGCSCFSSFPSCPRGSVSAQHIIIITLNGGQRSASVSLELIATRVLLSGCLNPGHLVLSLLPATTKLSPFLQILWQEVECGAVLVQSRWMLSSHCVIFLSFSLLLMMLKQKTCNTVPHSTLCCCHLSLCDSSWLVNV